MAMGLGRLALPQSDTTFFNQFSGIISLKPHLFVCIMVRKYKSGHRHFAQKFDADWYRNLPYGEKVCA